MDQATVEVNTSVGGGNGWGNDSVPSLSPCTLGITGGAAVTMTHQPKTFLEEVNANKSGKTSQTSYLTLTGGTTMLYN